MPRRLDRPRPVGLCFSAFTHVLEQRSEADLTDSVAVDAKRILLRYGAPIAVLDKVSETHRIEFAREIAKTMLPEREPRLRELLAEHGYTAAQPPGKKGRGKSKKKR